PDVVQVFRAGRSLVFQRLILQSLAPLRWNVQPPVELPFRAVGIRLRIQHQLGRGLRGLTLRSLMPEVAHLVDEHPGPLLCLRLLVRGKEDDVVVLLKLGEGRNETGVDWASTVPASARDMLFTTEKKDDR